MPRAPERCTPGAAAARCSSARIAARAGAPCPRLPSTLYGRSRSTRPPTSFTPARAAAASSCDPNADARRAVRAGGETVSSSAPDVRKRVGLRTTGADDDTVSPPPCTARPCIVRQRRRRRRSVGCQGSRRAGQPCAGVVDGVAVRFERRADDVLPGVGGDAGAAFGAAGFVGGAMVGGEDGLAERLHVAG